MLTPALALPVQAPRRAAGTRFSLAGEQNRSWRPVGLRPKPAANLQHTAAAADDYEMLAPLTAGRRALQSVAAVQRQAKAVEQLRKQLEDAEEALLARASAAKEAALTAVRQLSGLGALALAYPGAAARTLRLVYAALQQLEHTLEQLGLEPDECEDDAAAMAAWAQSQADWDPGQEGTLGMLASLAGFQQQQLQQQEQQVGSMQQAGDADLDEGAFFHYAVTLQYDGTNYWGFQLQPMAPAPAAGQPRGQRSKPTIQLRLEQALTKLTGEAREALKVQAAGRTDTGVHARGQVAQFRCRRQLAPDSIQRALNSRLPLDIRAVAVEAVPADFNVRYALSKTYRCAGWVAGGRWE